VEHHLEIAQSAIALVLVLVSVDRRAQYGPRKRALQLIAHSLGGAENYDPGPVSFSLDNLLKKHFLLAPRIVYHLDYLRYILVRCELIGVSNINNGWICKEFTG
jgi:hypothetical protein